LTLNVRIQTHRNIIIIAIIATTLSIASFLYFYNNGMTNLYGDGIAHVNIARKVVDSPDDSFWQRYLQIGSPWLPLQTVLMLPLVMSDRLWRTGVAGSLISMLCFVVTGVALFKLATYLYAKEGNEYRTILPFVTFAFFAFCPSVLFMQATPMTELVFMAALVVAVWMLQEWLNEQTVKSLIVAGIAMTVATMARYEAWPVAIMACALVLFLSRGSQQIKIKNAMIFSLVVAICPFYWLWHNWAIFGEPLWFLTGPNSARGIYLQNAANLGWSKIFVSNALLDVLLMTVTVAACLGFLPILLGATGFFRLLKIRKLGLLEHAPVLLLGMPFFFHCFSLYRGEIQIFPLSAFGLLNVRYGLPHVLALALFAPAVIPLLRRFGKTAAVASMSLLMGLQYGYLISDGVSQLAVYQEGYRNGVNSQPAREWAKAARFMRENPPSTTILMQTGSLGPVVSQGGLRFADIIHEGTSRWHEINDAIPDDIATVIVEKNDVLDERLQKNNLLKQEFAKNFQLLFETGKIKIFNRATTNK
jgi:hypothetical protein